MEIHIKDRREKATKLFCMKLEEKHTEESVCLSALYDMSFNGEIPLKIKTPYLEKALEFCTKRPDYPIKDVFDRRFLDHVRESGLDLIDLILAAGKLGINKLVDLLFDDVFHIVCSMTPEQLEKIFKVRYHHGSRVGFFWIDGLLNSLPPCPTLSEKDQKVTEDDIRFIVPRPPDEIEYLSEAERRYWVYAHLAFQCNTSLSIELSEQDAAAEKEEEEEEKIIVVHSYSSPNHLMELSNQLMDLDLKMETSITPYGHTSIKMLGETSIILHKKDVLIEEFFAMESAMLWVWDNGSYDTIPIKIESPCLEKALEFCVRRALFRRKYCFMSSMDIVALFDGKLLEDIKSGLDPVDLIHTASRLDIYSLFNLLFEDVVSIICEKKPEQVEKIFFKVCYNDVTRIYLDTILDSAPPCPKLSKAQQEEMKCKRKDILEMAPDDFKKKKLPDRFKRYWVYANLAIKRHPRMLARLLSKEDD